MKGAFSTRRLCAALLVGVLAIVVPAPALAGETIALVSIDVTPEAQTVALGYGFGYSATGTYSDGSTVNLTNLATWSSSDESVATVDSNGLITTHAEGQTSIKAVHGLEDSTVLTVGPPVLAGLVIFPDDPSVGLGGVKQFTAFGGYSDGSSANLTASVTWSSSLTSVATINSTGQASAVAEGQTTIEASMGALSDSTTLTVGPPELVDIEVTPISTTITLGHSLQFTATGTYSDGSTSDVTGDVDWSTIDDEVATISAGGLATGVGLGTTSVLADLGLLLGGASLTVNEDAPEPIRKPDAWLSIGDGPFVGDGTYNNDGTDQTRTVNRAPGRLVRFRVRLQNDGNYRDRLFVDGPGSITGYIVTYKRGSTDITDKVVAGTYLTAWLAPGWQRTIKMIVRVTNGAPPGSSLTGLLTSTSRADPTKSDTVKVVVNRL